ncbi:MAG TPA: hypothetical protein VL334_01025, partial [Anaerolineae bacterium]|nr:hypothetical protein [Anaerolineae bacterium]
MLLVVVGSAQPTAGQAEAPDGIPPGQWRCWWQPGNVPCNARLYGLDMLSADDGWAVGWHGTIMRWDGTVWRPVDSPTRSHLNAVSMAAPDDGWAVGEQTMLHWDGAAWTRAPTPRCALNAVAMVSATDGWAVGDCILRWNDSAWDPVFSPTWSALSSVALLSAQDGWAVGAGSAFLHWDGQVWANMNAALIGQGHSV